MAKILVIEGDKVTPLDKTKFTEEGKLQDYLEKYPSLIPLGETVEGASALLCIGREVGAGPGAIDLLFIDKDGLLTIVETKLRRNREARREVIGQIIEYASYISQWTTDKVYEIANAYLKSNLDEVMGNVGQGEFSVKDFRPNIEQNLNNGNIRCIIAVDELIEPLQATVTFLNSYSKFEILLLQVSNFEEKGRDRKILAPSLFGYKPLPSNEKRVQSTEDNFFEDARKRCNEDVVQAMEELYKFSEEKAAFIGWGTGAARRSFLFHGVKKGFSFFAIYSDGTIVNYVGGTETWATLDNEALKDFWATELTRRLEIDLPQNWKAYPWFNIRVSDLVQRNKLGEFKNAVLSLCQQIESGSDK
jgi:hypothetical protein